MKEFLNIGCGSHYLKEWTNLDLHSNSPDVIAHDITTRLPFEDNSFQFVYHCAVLEHLTPTQGRGLIKECLRVLQPGGHVRIGIPDLESWARSYMAILQAMDTDPQANVGKHRWLLIEFVDQYSREIAGGAMAPFLRESPADLRDFLLERIGEEGRQLMEPAAEPATTTSVSSPSALRRLLSWGYGWCLRHLVRERDLRALQLGRFRLEGEVHKAVYDRFMLGAVLEESGFTAPAVFPPSESHLPDWGKLHLDVTKQGLPRKPDCLFMEATKPHA